MSYPLPTQIPMVIEGLADQDAMIWSNTKKAWTNGGSSPAPGTVAVATDGVTIEGNGLTAEPLSVIGESVPVATDGVTIAGNGVSGNPLSVVADSVAIKTNASFTGVGTNASPLALATLGTAQTISSPLATTNGSGQVTMSKLSTQYAASWSALLTFSNTTLTNLNAASLNPSPTDWVNSISPTAGGFTASTGVYVCPVAGLYSMQAGITWVINATGSRFCNVNRVDQASSTLTQINGNVVAGSVSSNVGCGHIFLCNAGDQLYFQGYQNSGASLAANYFCCIALLQS
jgi:hypothetical protein